MTKKIMLFATAFLMANALSAKVEITPLWQWSSAQENLTETSAPNFITTGGSNRGIAYGKIGDAEYLFVTTGSGADANVVNYYNANTGAWVGKLNADLVNNSAMDTNHKIVDIECRDGYIITVSLSVQGKDLVFCSWAGINATPEIQILPVKTNIRVDKLSLSGSLLDGSARIWIAGCLSGDWAATEPVEVRYFEMNAAKTGFETTAKKFGEVADFNNMYNVAVNPDGSVLVKGNLRPLHLLDKNGNYLGNTDRLFPELGKAQSIKYIGYNKNNDRYYYILNSHSNASDAGESVVTKIYSMHPGNINSINCIAQLPFLGKAGVPNGNKTGDVDFKWNGDDLIVYSLASNNGFGAFNVTGLMSKSESVDDPKFITLWENTGLANNLPGYFTNQIADQNKVQSIAYGTVGGEECVYVVKKVYYDADARKDDIYDYSGNDRKNIFIHNAKTGKIISEIATGDIWGASIASLQDATVTQDGKLITTFVASSGEQFKAFMYSSNEQPTPETIIEYTSEDNGWMGVSLSSIGSVEAGTAKLYVNTGNPAGIDPETCSAANVYVFGMKRANQWEDLYAEQEIALPTSGNGFTAVKPDGSFYWCASDGTEEKTFSFVSSDGNVSANSSMLKGTSIQYIGHNESSNKDYIAVMTGYQAEIWSMTSGQPNTKELWGKTPLLGVEGSNEKLTGKVEVGQDTEGNPILYVLSTNNGFAAYKVNDLYSTSSINNTQGDNGISLFVDYQQEIVCFSAPVATTYLYSISGQLVKSSTNTETMDVKSLKGVYVIQYTNTQGIVVNQRIIL